MRWFGEDPWGEDTGEEEPSQLCLREDLEGEGGMRTLEQEVSEEDAAKMNYKGKWLKVEAEVDTGACIPMMPKSIAKHLPIRESEGSRKGAKYVSASDDYIYNEGESEVIFANDNGEWRKSIVQRGDVNKTLMAGGEHGGQGEHIAIHQVWGDGGGRPEPRHIQESSGHGSKEDAI